MSFRDQLYVIRQRAGLSQRAVSELIKVSRQTVNNWERGKTEPHRSVQHLTLMLLDKLPAKKPCATTKESDAGGELPAKKLRLRSDQSGTFGTREYQPVTVSRPIRSDSLDFEFGK